MAKSDERDKGKGGNRKSRSSEATVKTLQDLGVTKDESLRWQKLANVPYQLANDAGDLL